MVSFVDIIFLTFIVVFLLVRLYSVFGTRSSERNIKVILKPLDKQTQEQLANELSEMINNRAKSANVVETIVSGEQDKKLMKIEGFNKNSFLHSARRVFEVILQAFYKGNMEPVKDLISPKILAAFNQAISYRNENNQVCEMDFICFEKSEIADVKILKNSVKIVVEFVSEQVNILKNAEGEVIEGDENFIQKITDMWTFERSLNAKNNHWMLVSTKKSL